MVELGLLYRVRFAPGQTMSVSELSTPVAVAAGSPAVVLEAVVVFEAPVLVEFALELDVSLDSLGHFSSSAPPPPQNPNAGSLSHFARG